MSGSWSPGGVGSCGLCGSSKDLVRRDWYCESSGCLFRSLVMDTSLGDRYIGRFIGAFRGSGCYRSRGSIVYS